MHVDQSQVDEESTVSDTNKSHDEQEIQGQCIISVYAHTSFVY